MNTRIKVTLTMIVIMVLFLLTIWLMTALIDLKQKLDAITPGLFWVFVCLFAAASFWVIWRMLQTGGRQKSSVSDPSVPEVSSLQSQIAEYEQKGLDVIDVRKELEALHESTNTAPITIAIVGQVSTGKSSIAAKLLPDASIETSVLAGTTRKSVKYEWSAPNGDSIHIIDTPGLDEVQGEEREQLSKQATIPAHLVLYVLNGDLTRTQAEQLENLIKQRKMVLPVLNKTDQWSTHNIAILQRRVEQSCEKLGTAKPVLISAKNDHDIGKLVDNIQAIIDQQPDLLRKLRNDAVLLDLHNRLNFTVENQLQKKAQAIVDRYSRSAVAGALAAVSPGSDVIIQGVLGTRLVQSLCELYSVKPKELDVEALLKQVAMRSGRTRTLLLAISGNALKAFPGVGTLAGGLAHAVCYGLIFRSLGAAVSQTLAKRRELPPLVVATAFEENLIDAMENKANSVAKMALEAKQKSG